jgi:myo-inositol 2-dehydrogenase / D-chiro-inositol 1-dehydrogenase
MRLGLLGLGRIGAFHAETLTSLPEVDSLVVSDPVPALAEEVAGRLGAQVVHTHGPTSPRPAGSSATAPCTTSTPSGG